MPYITLTNHKVFFIAQMILGLRVPKNNMFIFWKNHSLIFSLSKLSGSMWEVGVYI